MNKPLLLLLMLLLLLLLSLLSLSLFNSRCCCKFFETGFRLTARGFLFTDITLSFAIQSIMVIELSGAQFSL